MAEMIENDLKLRNKRPKIVDFTFYMNTEGDHSLQLAVNGTKLKGAKISRKL